MGLPEVANKLAKALLEKAELIELYSRDVFVEATPSNIDELINSNRVVILFFTAEWCAPCLSQMSILREIAAEILKPGVVLAKVDVDKSYRIADRYGVQHIPSILVLANGNVVDAIVGSARKERLASKLKELVATYAL